MVLYQIPRIPERETVITTDIGHVDHGRYPLTYCDFVVVMFNMMKTIYKRHGRYRNNLHTSWTSWKEGCHGRLSMDVMEGGPHHIFSVPDYNTGPSTSKIRVRTHIYLDHVGQVTK